MAAAGATGLAGYYGAAPAYNYIKDSVKDYVTENPARALGAAGATYYGLNPSRIVPDGLQAISTGAQVVNAGVNVASAAIPAATEAVKTGYDVVKAAGSAVVGASGLANYMSGSDTPYENPWNTADEPQSYPTSMQPESWDDPIGSFWNPDNFNFGDNSSLAYNTFQPNPTFTTRFDAYIGGY